MTGSRSAILLLCSQVWDLDKQMCTKTVECLDSVKCFQLEGNWMVTGRALCQAEPWLSKLQRKTPSHSGRTTSFFWGQNGCGF